MTIHTTTARARQRPDDGLPPLREVILSKDRQKVDTTGEVWVVRASADGGDLLRLDWTLIDQDLGVGWAMPQRDREIFKRHVAYLVQTRAAKTAANAFNHVRTMIRKYVTKYAERQGEERAFAWHRLTVGELIALLRDDDDTAMRGHYFMQLRALYQWGTWNAQLPDFDSQTALRLEIVRAQGNVKGQAVRLLDPNEGPLAEAETRDLQRLVIERKGRDTDRAAVMLFRELGLNPHSVSRMQNRHLHCYEGTSSETGKPIRLYQLDVPRVKKRTERTTYRKRPISRELGDLLVSLQQGPEGGLLLHWLPKAGPSKALAKALGRWAREAGLTSARTGTILRLTPRRLRYTMASEMARRGYSRRLIAEMLDHSDLQNVEVYIEASSYVIDQVGARLAPVYRPLAARFAGRVVDRTAPPPAGLRRRVVPGTAVELPQMPLDVGGIGLCARDVAKQGLCDKGGVLGCYVCDRFCAFRDGPHAKVAESLEQIVQANPDAVTITEEAVPALSAVRQLIAQIEREQSNREGQ